MEEEAIAFRQLGDSRGIRRAKAGDLPKGLRPRPDCGRVRATFMLTDSWQIAFFAAAAMLVLFKAWRGWRLGVARQVISLAALAGAYLAGIFGGRFAVPILRPVLGFPEPVLILLGGALLGLAVYLSVSLIGAILFKKTAEQRVGVVRLGYGFSGAAVGAVFGLFLVWIAVLAIRLLGSVAETQIAVAKNPRITDQRTTPTPTPRAMPSSQIIHGLAHMKRSLEHGTAGAMVQHVDPIPTSIYLVLTKLGMMVSNEQSIARFLAYPGVQPLLAHPKISALQNDAEITRDILAHNYFSLLRNNRIVAAASDAEIGELMRKFEFEKALDYALRAEGKESRGER